MMLYTLRISALALLLALTGCNNTDRKQEDKYRYETVEGDPLDAKIYTLANGLKLYMSVNKEEPRVMAQVAVRTGSKQDPADATGLAHYLEHMLFKGNSQYGTKDWAAEEMLLKNISDLYESHRNTTDMDERKKIYHQIDSISGVAAEMAIANEYDKMVASLGAQGTNAYTWYEQTVYINDIPANELEKWAMLESDRFSELVLRLFHTELEAVYEEFNRTQDSDNRQAYYAMMQSLFETHPYGTQTTIGTSEHLKSPSMEKIQAYFKERYVPNNMAIVLSGDIDPDKTVAIIEKYFGDYERREIKDPTFEPERELRAPIVKDLSGVQAEFVTIGYRLPGSGSPEATKLKVLDGILSNGKAGLIDLNLVQKQKVLRAYSSPSVFKDYSILTLSGNPREGQDLEEVGQLLRGEIEKIQNGDFEDWMIEAVVNDMKLRELRSSTSNRARASKMVDAFVYGEDWNSVVNEYDAMSKLSKADLQSFAKKWFGDNYVQVNKRLGTNMAVKVEKPIITPVNIDREIKSAYFLKWDSVKSERISPEFLDYKAEIETKKLDNGLTFNRVENKDNELFSLYYILDMGSNHDLEMALAISYLPYLGTSDMTAEQLQQELFKLGVSFNVFSSKERSYVTLSGLNKSLEPGLKLFEKVLANVKADNQAYNDMVAGILKSRQDAMKNKGQILFGALSDYAQYGSDSPTKHILSKEELTSTSPDVLTQRIRDISAYEHRIFYYGPQDAAGVMSLLETYHKVPTSLKTIPEPKNFEEQNMGDNKVYFTDYDMVQAEVLMLSKGSPFNVEMAPEIDLFNEYFGSGLSSIVFQEIRESKALAYSAYSSFTTPNKEEESHYIKAYIGAQVDKLPEATAAMLDLMNNMPKAQIQFESARDAAMKKIETNRTTGASIFWSYLRAKELGIDYDINKTVYDSIQTMDFEDLQHFFDANIKDRNYAYCVIGNEVMIDKSMLQKLGKVKVLSLEELFGYSEADKPAGIVSN